MSEPAERPSARRDELLEKAYAYVLTHGLSAMSLRPLAAAIDSSPRVLLFLFGSKEELVRALLTRARREEFALLDTQPTATDLATTMRVTWRWLADTAHRPLLALWAEAYSRSLTAPEGPWAGFARATVEDWLPVLGPGGIAERTLALAVLRGTLLDLLATGDLERCTRAVELYIVRIGDAEATGGRR